jgi:putative transcriptional regulator
MKADSRQGVFEKPPGYPPERVVLVRKSIAGMSQVAFAALINVSVSTVRKWESPTADKYPRGAAARLLQIVESKGIDALAASST